jgi:hypothetical protein
MIQSATRIVVGMPIEQFMAFGAVAGAAIGATRDMVQQKIVMAPEKEKPPIIGLLEAATQEERVEVKEPEKKVLEHWEPVRETVASVQLEKPVVQEIIRPAVEKPVQPVVKTSKPKQQRPEPKISDEEPKQMPPSNVVFCTAMAEIMNHRTLKSAAKKLENGKITDDEFIAMWQKAAGTKKYGDPEQLINRAKELTIECGFSPDDPFLVQIS